MASEHNFVFCATDWWGLVAGDVPYDISALQDLNNFPAVVDRLQQGVLNTLLSRAADANPDGFASDPAFQNGRANRCSTPRTCTTTATARAGSWAASRPRSRPTYTRAVLGVTGMDYGGLLLQRSTDFTAFANFLYGNAPGGGYTDARSTR